MKLPAKNSMKLYRKLSCMTTKILVAIQQQQQQNGWLDFFSFKKISETTGQNSMKLERKLLCMPLQKYKRLHYWSSTTDRGECKEKDTWVRHISVK